MDTFAALISVTILWFLITLFTRSTNSSQTLTESWIVVIGMLIANLLIKLLLGGLPVLIGRILSVIILYFMVDKICGTSKQTTMRICIWYFVISALISLFFRMLAS